MRAFYKPLSFVTLKLKTSCKFIPHLSLSCVTLSLPAFSVPVSLHMQGLFFTDTLPTYSTHLGISRLISLHCPSGPSQTQTFPRPSDCNPLRKASTMPHTQWQWGSTSHPASSGTGAEHPSPLLGGCLSLCSSYTWQPMQRKAFMGFTIVELSGNQASCHWELLTSLWAAASTEPRCQEQQSSNAAQAP